jgi:hypothetical protein
MKPAFFFIFLLCLLLLLINIYKKNLKPPSPTYNQKVENTRISSEVKPTKLPVLMQYINSVDSNRKCLIDSTDLTSIIEFILKNGFNVPDEDEGVFKQYTFFDSDKNRHAVCLSISKNDNTKSNCRLWVYTNTKNVSEEKLAHSILWDVYWPSYLVVLGSGPVEQRESARKAFNELAVLSKK